MRLKLFLLNLLLLLGGILTGQNKSLFCLQGQYMDTEPAMSEFNYFNDEFPRMLASQRIKYGVRLSKIENKKLIVLDTLVKTGFMIPFQWDTIKNRTKMIRIYHEQKLFRIMYDQFYADTTYFIEGDFSKKIKFSNCSTPNNVTPRYLAVVENGKSYFYYNDIIDKKWVYYKIDIPGKKENKTTVADFNYYRSEGYNGIGLDDVFSRIYSNFTEKIELRRELIDGDTLLVTSMGKAPFHLPHYEQLIDLDCTKRNLSSKYGRILFMINTDKMIVMPAKGEMVKDGFIRYNFLYNKKKEQWQSVGLPSAFHTLHAFGNWLAGHVVFVRKAGREQRINKGIEISGKKYRRQDTTIWGMNADTRFNIQEIFPTGKLFIYHIDTEQYIEWDAKQNGENQADSEILLIENEKIYYRVNDALYVRDIIDGKSLGERTLLVQEETVPYVHWLFFAEE